MALTQIVNDKLILKGLDNASDYSPINPTLNHPALRMTTPISSAAIAENICFFIRSHLVASGIEVTPATPLERLGLDSFSLIEIILFVERQYQLQLSDEALSQENICSSETLANYVHQQLS